MTDRLLDTYAKMLTFAGLPPDDEGHILVSYPGTKKTAPLVLDGKRLVLPVDNIMNNFDAESMVIFHPFRESLFRSESPIAAKVRASINVRFNLIIGGLIHSLLDLVGSEKLHRELSAEQAELMTKIHGYDKTVTKNFMSFFTKACASDPERIFVNVYIRANGGTYKKRKYNRVGISNFPILQAIDEQSIEGFRPKDYEILKAMMEYILPDCAEAEKYNVGCNSDYSPSLIALYQAAFKIAFSINSMVDLYRDYIKHADDYSYDLSWIDIVDEVETLASEIKMIPSQEGNSGESKKTEAEPVIVSGGSYAERQRQLQQQRQPQQVQQVQQPQNNQALTYRERMAQRGGQQQMVSQTPPMVLIQTAQGQMLVPLDQIQQNVQTPQALANPWGIGIQQPQQNNGYDPKTHKPRWMTGGNVAPAPSTSTIYPANVGNGVAVAGTRPMVAGSNNNAPIQYATNEVYQHFAGLPPVRLAIGGPTGYYFISKDFKTWNAVQTAEGLMPMN